MLSSTISLNDASAASKSFVQNKISETGSTRIDTTTNLSAPRTMVIGHTTSGQGAKVVDRHLIQFSHNETDLAGNLQTAVVNVTISVPRAAAISRVEIDDLIAFARNFTGVSANIDSILRNES